MLTGSRLGQWHRFGERPELSFEDRTEAVDLKVSGPDPGRRLRLLRRLRCSQLYAERGDQRCVILAFAVFQLAAPPVDSAVAEARQIRFVDEQIIDLPELMLSLFPGDIAAASPRFELRVHREKVELLHELGHHLSALVAASRDCEWSCDRRVSAKLGVPVRHNHHNVARGRLQSDYGADLVEDVAVCDAGMPKVWEVRVDEQDGARVGGELCPYGAC